MISKKARLILAGTLVAVYTIVVSLGAFLAYRASEINDEFAEKTGGSYTSDNPKAAEYKAIIDKAMTTHKISRIVERFGRNILYASLVVMLTLAAVGKIRGFYGAACVMSSYVVGIFAILLWCLMDSRMPYGNYYFDQFVLGMAVIPCCVILLIIGFVQMNRAKKAKLQIDEI